MSLQTLQRQFQSALTGGNVDFRRQVESTPEASADTRLAIYGEAYRLRLQEVLARDYDKLADLLGDAQFEALCRTYIDSHPSHHPSLRWFGQHMAGFLADTTPWKRQPILAELAAFEWTQGEVFDAPDAPVVGPEALAGLPAQAWANLRLQPHPALRHLRLTWNAPAVWRSLDGGETPPAPVAGEAPVHWLFWRRDLDIHWRSLGGDESRAIDAWCDGAGFAELCEGLCEWMDPGVVAAYAATLLKGWLADGLVSALLTD